MWLRFMRATRRPREDRTMTTTTVGAEHIPRLRWGIGVLLGAGVINYLFPTWLPEPPDGAR
jgi:hypothetical protein